jgi:heterodisulfide reductase subunit A
MINKALVIGAGIAGIQASLDIANSGYPVALVDRQPSIGGHMAQLSETFPTLDCSQCIMTPRTVEVGHHENIQLYTYSEVADVSACPDFTVKIGKRPYVNWDACTGCMCARKMSMESAAISDQLASAKPSIRFRRRPYQQAGRQSWVCVRLHPLRKAKAQMRRASNSAQPID